MWVYPNYTLYTLHMQGPRNSREAGGAAVAWSIIVTKHKQQSWNGWEANSVNASKRFKRNHCCDLKSTSIPLPCTAQSCRRQGKAASAPTLCSATSATPGNKQAEPSGVSEQTVEYQVNNTGPAHRRLAVSWPRATSCKPVSFSRRVLLRPKRSVI